MEKFRKKDQKLMCNRCFNVFSEEIEYCPDCRLRSYLFAIDNGMIDIVRELNLKGYNTVMCCEGHTSKAGITKTFKEVTILISFTRKYDFNFGGNWNRAHSSLYTLSIPYRVETKTKKQKESNWAEQLEEWRVKKLAEILEEVKKLDKYTEAS